MAETYTRVFTLEEDLYTSGSPVLIRAGALLKSAEGITAQFRFRNIGGRDLKALLISLRALDVLGREVRGVEEFQYLDLNVARGGEFGSRVPVPVPDPTTRSVEVRCTAAVFADGSRWYAPEGSVWEPIPPQEPLEAEYSPEEIRQYRRDLSDAAVNIPRSHRDLWQCTCGCFCGNQEETCFGCGLERAGVLACLDHEQLRSRAEAYEREQQEARERAEAQEQQRREQARIEAEQRRKKLIPRVIGVIAAAVLILSLVYVLMYPKIRDRKILNTYKEQAVQHIETDIRRELGALYTAEDLDRILEYGRAEYDLESCADNDYQLCGTYLLTIDGNTREIGFTMKGDSQKAVFSYDDP